MWVHFSPFTRHNPAQITLIPSDPRPTLLISWCRLIEQIYKFPQSSLAELARNSVVQSGFEMEVKRHWLGPCWYLPGDAGNEITKVCVFFLLFEMPSSGCLSFHRGMRFCGRCILIADRCA